MDRGLEGMRGGWISSSKLVEFKLFAVICNAKKNYFEEELLTVQLDEEMRCRMEIKGCKKCVRVLVNCNQKEQGTALSLSHTLGWPRNKLLKANSRLFFTYKFVF
jgi:hypothetical protein